MKITHDINITQHATHNDNSKHVDTLSFWSYPRSLVDHSRQAMGLSITTFIVLLSSSGALFIKKPTIAYHESHARFDDTAQDNKHSNVIHWSTPSSLTAEISLANTIEKLISDIAAAIRHKVQHLCPPKAERVCQGCRNRTDGVCSPPGHKPHVEGGYLPCRCDKHQDKAAQLSRGIDLQGSSC